MRRATHLGFLIWLLAVPVLAQPNTGSLTGVVRDQSGGVLPGATVTVAATGGAEQTAVTDSVGRYTIGPLAPGTYRVTVDLPGFVTATQAAVQVSPGQQVTTDFTLAVGGTSEVVTVTARRVEETLQEVPISVSVVSSEEIRQRAIVDFSALAFQMPNVLVEEAGNRPGRTGVTIRGVPGRTGIYMDDVFVGDASANNVMMLDTERVEVLRGPQGTLFGRNSIAGTINTITSRPSTTAWVSNASVWAGDYAAFSGSATATGPIVKDKVGISVAAGFRKRDGYEETVGGLNVNNENQWAARGKLLFTPNKDVSLLFSADYHHDDSRVGYGDAVEDFGLFGAFYRQAAAAGRPYDRIVGNRNVEGRTERDVYGGSAKLEWKGRGPLVQSITGFRKSTSDNYRDGDGGIADIVTGNQPVDYRSFSQEFRLSGSGGRFDWQAGFYYFKDRRRFTDFNRLGPDFAVAVVPQLAPLVGNPFGIVTIGMIYQSPLLQALTGLRPPTPYGDRSTFNENEIASTAAYGSLTWHLSPKIDATVGLRYTHENIDAAYSQDGVAWSPIDPDIPLTALTAKDDDVSPLGSIVFKVTPSFSLYGTASRGFQSGGFNLAPGSATAEQRRFEPEKVSNFEAGVKHAFDGGRWFASGAVFLMKYQDFQRSQSRVTNQGQITSTFNTDATVKGFEVELSGSAWSRLTVAAGLGYQDSTYDDYPNAPVNTQTGLVIVDLTGETLPFVPKWTSSLSTFYRIPIASAVSLNVGGDLQYRSNYRVNDGPDPRLVVKDTTLLNAEAGVRFERVGLELRVRGQNLLDRSYITSLDFNNLSGATAIDLSAPRTVFVELRMYFH